MVANPVPSSEDEGCRITGYAILGLIIAPLLPVGCFGRGRGRKV